VTRTLLVVGHGMVGHRLVEQLRTRDPGRTWRVVVVGEEHHLAYDRVGLSSYLDGKSRDDLTLVGANLLNDPRVDLLLGSPVTAVDRTARTARTAHGEHLRYDALILATGSRPFVPPVPGHGHRGCFVYRTFDDLDALRAAARPGRPGIVVGGGLLGLEAANALRLLGMRAHVVESGPHLMPAQLDAGAAEVLHRHVTGLGLGLHCATSVASIDAGSGGRVTWWSSPRVSGRATNWPARWAWPGAGAAASPWTPSAVPPTSGCGRSVTARRWTAAATAWWPPGTAWRTASRVN
jgi:nitrite reductase (NADH) large subunit